MGQDALINWMSEWIKGAKDFSVQSAHRILQDLRTHVLTAVDKNGFCNSEEVLLQNIEDDMTRKRALLRLLDKTLSGCVKDNEK